MKRAYSIFQITKADDDERVITGVATTPTPDKVNDIVDPEGVKYDLPIPFLWQHDHSSPIGEVTEVKVKKDEITFKAKIAIIDKAGKLKDQVDYAWDSIKSGLVKGVSIGFSPIEYAFVEATGGVHFKEWLWNELSAVTIPANSEASIQTIKKLDEQFRESPSRAWDSIAQKGKSNQPNQGKLKMSYADQLAAAEASRLEKAQSMQALIAAEDESGETMNEKDSEQFDALEKDVAALDKRIARLKSAESLNVASAAPVNNNVDKGFRQVAIVGGNGNAQVTQEREKEKGIGFARYTISMAAANGNVMHALHLAKQHYKDDGQLHQYIEKAAVGAANTGVPGNAGVLNEPTFLASEFIEWLNPQTLIGRIPGLRQVPFFVKMPRQIAAGASYWVGEGKAKPLTSAGFDTVSMDYHKQATIAVMTDEMRRFSNPSIEVLVRDTLRDAIVIQADADFLDPANAGGAASPASITNGVTATSASGTTAADFRNDARALFTAMITANMSAAGGMWLAREQTAMSLGMIQNPLGQPEFPGLNAEGGNLLGYPVVTSQSAPDALVFLKPNEVLYASDNAIDIALADQATLEMDDAPTMASDAPVAPVAPTALVNMFQTNSVAVRAERAITWMRRRDGAVQLISAPAYV